METIDYSKAKPNWTTVTRTKKDGTITKQHRVTLRYYDADHKRKGKTKLFTPEESAKMDTERKRDNALRKWIAALTEEQEAAIEREEQEKREAEERKLEAEERKLEEQRQAELNACPTVAKYVTNYIDTIEAAGTVRPSAISDYRTSAKRISEGIGDIPLRDLKPAMIQDWEAKLLKGGKGVNTVLKYHRLLNSVCKHAMNVRDLDWNPCSAVKKPKRVAPSPNSLDANQYARLYATLDAMEATPIVTAATIALFTGMREGEVCGLKWKCYDDKAGIIRVEKAIAKAGGKKYETEPKTEASKRDIPVHPSLASMLERRRTIMLADLKDRGVLLDAKDFGELYVVGAVDGSFFDPTLLSRAWKLMADSYNLIGTQGRRVTFHDLRHSFATRAIAEGADVKAVAAVLGHTDARVTLNVYADADKESKRNAVTRAGDGIEAQGDVAPYKLPKDEAAAEEDVAAIVEVCAIVEEV